MTDDPHQLAAVLVDQAEAAGATEYLLHEIRRRCLHDVPHLQAGDMVYTCRRCGLVVPAPDPQQLSQLNRLYLKAR
jgi:hypothetical protein